LTEHLFDAQLTEMVMQARVGDVGAWWSSLDDEPRAVGRGWHGYGLHSRIHDPGKYSKHALMDLEIADDGSIALFATGLADTKVLDDGTHLKCAWAQETASLVRSVVRLAATVGTTFGYAGQWQLAVGLTNLTGCCDAGLARGAHSRHDIEELPRYSADRYLGGTLAATAELRDAPGTVTSRLAYRFLRALDVATTYAAVIR
jgi:hypothetical protein